MASSVNYHDFVNTQIGLLNTQKESQDRLTQLNDSYRKRYSKYVEMMIVVIFAVIVYLGAQFLSKIFPSVGGTVADTINVVVFIAVVIYLAITIYKLNIRDNTNYDELDILPVAGTDGVHPSASEGQLSAYALASSCKTADCCTGPDVHWNSDLNKCEVNASSASCGAGTRFENGKCIPDCSTGTAWNTATRACGFTNMADAFPGTPLMTAHYARTGNADPAVLNVESKYGGSELM